MNRSVDLRCMPSAHRFLVESWSRGRSWAVMAAWLLVAAVLICPALTRLPCAYQAQGLDTESLQAEEQDHKGAEHAVRLMRRIARKVVRCSSLAAPGGRPIAAGTYEPPLHDNAPHLPRLNEHSHRNGIGAPLRC